MEKIDVRLGRSSHLIYKMPIESRKKLLQQIWFKKMGYELDLDHPKDFNEKLQWYKLYYHHPNMTRCVDKVTFKDYVAEKLGEGYTAKLFRVWNSSDEVNFDGLPKQFVVKSNCQDNGKYIAIVQDKTTFDFKALEREIKDYWFNPINLLINGFCSAYHNVKPKVFVEEYIDQKKETPDDCKLFCFNGEPKFCYMTKEHFRNDKVDISEHPYGFYDLNWNHLNIKYGEHQIYFDAQKPKHLSEMILIARKLAHDFPFVRVDFFDAEAKVYLAELTFYPGGGLVKYDPPEFSENMGKMFKIF